MLFILVLSGFLQVFIGYKYFIMEGLVGVWWGVFFLYVSFGIVLFGFYFEMFCVLQFIFFISGIIVILMSLFGFIDKLVKYFILIVIGIYLILLVMQFSGFFLKGMFGIIEMNLVIKFFIVLVLVVILLLIFYLLLYWMLNKFSIIISIGVGWGVFVMLGLVKFIEFQVQLFYIFKVFVFGVFCVEWNMVVIVFFVMFILIINMLVFICVVEFVYKYKGEKIEKDNIKCLGMVLGISQLFGGLFLGVGVVFIFGFGGFILVINFYS